MVIEMFPVTVYARGKIFVCVFNLLLHQNMQLWKFEYYYQCLPLKNNKIINTYITYDTDLDLFRIFFTRIRIVCFNYFIACKKRCVRI